MTGTSGDMRAVARERLEERRGFVPHMAEADVDREAKRLDPG